MTEETSMMTNDKNSKQLQLLSTSNIERTDLFNSFDANFYTNSFDDETNQSACHLIINPVSKSFQINNVKQLEISNSNNDSLLPSISNEKNFTRPSTICYQTFKNKNSPFNSPLKRSSTFAGVFNSIFKQQQNYNHLIEPNIFLDDKQSIKLSHSKSNYNYENRFSENEHRNRRLIKTISSTSLIPNIGDIQSIRKSLMSLAVSLTKHSTSNQGRIVELNKSNPQLNSLSTTSSTSSNSSLYTNNEASTVIAMQEDSASFNLNLCTLCLQYIEPNEFIILEICKCGFCRPCLEQYCTIMIRDHSLILSQIVCPSSDCPNSKNSFLSCEQIKRLVDKSSFKLFEKIKLDLEVHLDPMKVWCPRPNCETVCEVSPSTEINKIENNFDSSIHLDLNSQTLNDQKIDRRVPVNCKNCDLTFCLHCRSSYHGKMPCQSPSEDESLSLLLSRTPNSLYEYIEKCPRCSIWIERDKGCAQMMCQKCKHVFCWFCLSSLEEDFLLRHYDSGACKNKLGHSKGTLIWLRLQVVAVFLGFALFLLLVAPLLLISGPILLIAHFCCDFSFRAKIWTKEDDLDTMNQSQTNLNNSNRQIKLPDNHQTNLIDESNSHLIDLSEINEKRKNSTGDKNEKLIQAYIQSNGTHRIVNSDQQLNNDDLFEEYPIKLSGYDRNEIEDKKDNGFLSWFKRNKSKPDPPPRLSSMLDVEKHRKFIEELLMPDKLNLDNELNSDINNHYMIIKPPENADQDAAIKRSKWWTFWRKN